MLYINACVRKESRTNRLARVLIGKLNQPCEEICLEDLSFPVVNEEYLNRPGSG